jgi:hypothetical protein
VHYIGVDYHKRYSYVVVKDGEGRVERRAVVSNTKEELQHFLNPYRSGEGSAGGDKELGAHL